MFAGKRRVEEDCRFSPTGPLYDCGGKEMRAQARVQQQEEEELVLNSCLSSSAASQGTRAKRSAKCLAV